ncbi:unnamed protein product (macronuclear) [Paramecium tetraurelia]|uniref:G domain-containing protein n=1 Tax=Paramecium tetraurelia TaxID=5888 RepID=A0C297_PARTE|nr:uncharacterized protein GSPATT00034391001 [Paramecium tetraurelia]CAK64914.1 unnamed protein product [Paramecium tetraurelia]|eukprot:XP_001432311.1 hypothetical protein (macronuclear) [Paramecium tetraurelia strain d4-2]
MDSLQDTEFLDLVEKCQKIIDQYEQDDEISTVLLIGNHYSGKSTVFNFLSGANFNFNDEAKQIEIANKQDKFSQMNNGTKSITKTPLNVYKNNQNNHVIIDFPAEFLNTDKSKDQQLIKLLFNKVVTSGPIKLIYILQCYDDCLPNRGTDLVHFSKMLNNPNFSLLLNKNHSEKSDEQLICKIKKQWEESYQINFNKTPKKVEQIHILKKAYKNSLEVIFNDYSRKTLWCLIEQAKEIEIKPLEIPYGDELNLYKNNLEWEFVNDYLNHLLQENQNQKDQKQTENDEEELFYFVKIRNQKTALQWYQKFFELCNKIIQITSINSNKMVEKQGFNKINCQSNLDVIISFVKNQLQNIEEIYQKRKQYLNIQQNLEKKMNLQFKEIQNTIKKLLEGQFQLEKENLRLKTENEKEKLQRQILEKQLKL